MYCLFKHYIPRQLEINRLDLQWTETHMVEQYENRHNYNFMVLINKDFLKVWLTGELHDDSDTTAIVSLSYYCLVIEGPLTLRDVFNWNKKFGYREDLPELLPPIEKKISDAQAEMTRLKLIISKERAQAAQYQFGSNPLPRNHKFYSPN